MGSLANNTPHHLRKSSKCQPTPRLVAPNGSLVVDEGISQARQQNWVFLGWQKTLRSALLEKKTMK